MIYIIISGIDGSGKTSVINTLQNELTKQGKNTQYIWLRYNHYFVKPLHALARLIGLSRKHKSAEGKVWRHEFYKSKLFSALYIRFTILDTYIGRLKLKKELKKVTDIVICDRWINDIAIDLGTKTHNEDFLETSYFKRLQKIIPENSFQFIIYRETKKLLKCRMENREDPEFNYRNQFYGKLQNYEFVHSIDNNGTIVESVKQILSVLNNG